LASPNALSTRKFDCMVKVSFMEHDGTLHSVQAPAGVSLMAAAVKNGVPGIDADCGGSCACATCQVYVDSAWSSILGEMSSDENDMLDFVRARMPNSRLSCQITINQDMEGLSVRMPESQR
jgi:ferredoxin, 2Fe-2S